MVYVCVGKIRIVKKEGKIIKNLFKKFCRFNVIYWVNVIYEVKVKIYGVNVLYKVNEIYEVNVIYGLNVIYIF